MSKIFPIQLYCDRGNGWSDSTFRETFLKAKSPSLTWYGYDVVITSATSIYFIVYSMRDAYHGGLGQPIKEIHLDVDSRLTRAHIEQAALREATRRRKKELEAAEQLVYQSYAEELLAEEGLT